MGFESVASTCGDGLERGVLEEQQSREEMSRRKESVPNTCLYRRRRSRLSVGQHAFEINGGGFVSLFLKHAIAQFVRARLFWETTMERIGQRANQRAAGLFESRIGRLAWGLFVRSRHLAGVAVSVIIIAVPGSAAD